MHETVSPVFPRRRFGNEESDVVALSAFSAAPKTTAVVLGLVLGDDPIPLADWEKLKCDQQPNDNGPSRCVFVEVNDDDSVGLNQRGYYWIVGKQPEQVDRLL
jgi:hypothetical protein